MAYSVNANLYMQNAIQLDIIRFLCILIFLICKFHSFEVSYCFKCFAPSIWYYINLWLTYLPADINHRFLFWTRTGVISNWPPEGTKLQEFTSEKNANTEKKLKLKSLDMFEEISLPYEKVVNQLNSSTY